jgi:hypothetical protein
MKLLIGAHSSSLFSLGVAIIQVPLQPPFFLGGDVNISFSFASKFASKSYYYVPNPSSPAVILSVIPSEVSELGGRTVQLNLNNLQVVDSRNSLECLLGSSLICDVLDVK